MSPLNGITRGSKASGSMAVLGLSQYNKNILYSRKGRRAGASRSAGARKRARREANGAEEPGASKDTSARTTGNMAVDSRVRTANEKSIPDQRNRRGRA